MKIKTPPGTDKRAGKTRPADNKIVQDVVSNRLRAFYSEIEHEQIPQHLVDLLEKLDKNSSQ